MQAQAGVGGVVALLVAAGLGEATVSAAADGAEEAGTPHKGRCGARVKHTAKVRVKLCMSFLCLILTLNLHTGRSVFLNTPTGV